MTEPTGHRRLRPQAHAPHPIDARVASPEPRPPGPLPEPVSCTRPVRSRAARAAPAVVFRPAPGQNAPLGGSVMTTPASRLRATLPASVASGAAAIRADWKVNDKVRRVWDGDATVWTGGDEGRWLGWLRLPAAQLADGARFPALSAEAKTGGVSHVVVLGMGGSSLCPEVLRTSFAGRAGAPELLVSTRPTPRRSPRSRRGSRSRRRSSSSRASRAARSSRTSSRPTSSSAP